MLSSCIAFLEMESTVTTGTKYLAVWTQADGSREVSERLPDCLCHRADIRMWYFCAQSNWVCGECQYGQCQAPISIAVASLSLGFVGRGSLSKGSQCLLICSVNSLLHSLFTWNLRPTSSPPSSVATNSTQLGCAEEISFGATTLASVYRTPTTWLTFY